MSPTGWFTTKYFFDFLAGFNDNNWMTAFRGWYFNNYLKYVAINFGLGGQVTKISSRQLIEGYVDPILQKFASMPVYQGGDITINPIISLK